MAPGKYTRIEADVDMQEDAEIRDMEGPPLGDGVDAFIDGPAER